MNGSQSPSQNQTTTMSSLPGLKLEDYLSWQWDLIVDGDGHANKSLQMVEALGRPTRRLRITQEQFLEILTLYEPWRKYLEDKLSDFDDDTMSWRDYAGYGFGNVPTLLEDRVERIRSRFRALQNQL